MAIGIHYSGGIDSALSCSFTLGHGISPNGGTIDIVPQKFVPDPSGDLRLSDGVKSITFYDVRLDSPFMRRTTQGEQVLTFRVYDRRWRWQFGDIYGRYNFRDSGNTFILNSEKTPQEIATLLLDAMNEVDYDVSQLPNDTRPEVDWIGNNPADELQELAESLGCRVVLKTDNTVALLRQGVGDEIPKTFRVTKSDGYNPSEVPEILKVISGPVRFQQKFELEAVGKDKNGSIKPIDDLSYAPAGGWENESPYYPLGGSSDQEARSLAQETVWKWYRIISPEFPESVYDMDGDVVTNKLRDIIPIDDFLVDNDIDPDNNAIPQKAKIDGVYWAGAPAKHTTNTYGAFQGSWSLDRDRGIVMFSDFVLLIDGDKWKPAELYLTCSFTARDEDTRQTVRYFRQRTLANGIPGTGRKVIRRDEIVPTIKVNYDSSGTPIGYTKNTTSIQNEADYQLDAAQIAYEDVTTQEGEYIGIFDISPDGAIQQVSWEVRVNDSAKTRASMNSEHNLKVPSYDEFKRIRQTKQAAQNAKAFKAKWRDFL